MQSDRALLVSGVLLLAISALLGFIQERHRGRPDAFASWRVVHVGGTAGAVQLLALAATWEHFFPRGPGAALVVAGVIFATWAFFIGPLAKATGHARIANSINRLGAVAAVPAYLALPVLILL